MRIVFAGVVAVLLAASSPLSAQNDQVLTGRAPDWVDASQDLAVPADAAGLVFVRRQDMQVHLGKEGQFTYQGQRFKLLHPQALQFGNLALTWNPAAGAPTVHGVRVHRDGEVIDVLANSKFEILRREDQLEQAMLNGLLTAVLRVPDLRVGDELEWDYTVPSHDPTFRDHSFGLMLLGAAPPAGRFRLGVTWEGEQEPAIRLTKDLEGAVQVSPSALAVSIDNPAILTAPKDAPPRFSWQRIIEYSDFASWPAVSQRVSTLFTEASQLEANSQIAREAARIAAAYPGQLERAQAALELVQQEVRYIYVGLEGGNYRPATADETWRRRYGDCKGKSALLLALLRELGVRAEPALVNNSGVDDGFDARLPNPGLFNHIIVRTSIGDETFWLDATLPPVAEASLTPIGPYRWVLPLTDRGAALEAVPQAPFSLPHEMGLYEIDARAGFDEPARLVTTTVKRGLPGLEQHLQLSALTPGQLTDAFRNSLEANGEWNSIENVEYRYDRATSASILTIAGTGPVDWEDEGAGGHGLALPGGGFSPPARRQRAGGNDQDAPFYADRELSCYVTTVRLPTGTPLENWGYNTVFSNEIYGRRYYRMMERRDDGTIRMVRGSRVEEPEISADLARRDNDRLKDFDNSKAYITYDPNRTMAATGLRSRVPATYEIDWTGPDAPCLPLVVSAVSRAPVESEGGSPERD